MLVPVAHLTRLCPNELRVKLTATAAGAVSQAERVGASVAPCVLEVFDSKLGRDTTYSERWFSEVFISSSRQ
jgi:hypothetical protein